MRLGDELDYYVRGPELLRDPDFRKSRPDPAPPVPAGVVPSGAPGTPAEVSGQVDVAPVPPVDRPHGGAA